MGKERVTVSSRGVQLPAIGNWQLALYVDRSAAGQLSPGLWRDRWGHGPGAVMTLGADGGAVALRMVLERLQPGAIAEWGLQ